MKAEESNLALTFPSCLSKQEAIKALFETCTSQEAIYQKIIESGKQLTALAAEYKTPGNIVSGCQSIVYLRSYFQSGKIFFEADSEAMISKGLAYLLIVAYSGEPPEAVLKCPPLFIAELGLQTSLTPSRSNGLASIHLRMKQDALKHLINK